MHGDIVFIERIAADDPAVFCFMIVDGAKRSVVFEESEVPISGDFGRLFESKNVPVSYLSGEL